MRKYIEARVLMSAKLLIEDDYNIRQIAGRIGVCKSTTHIDLTKRLPKVKPQLMPEVKKRLESHWEVKHIKGGQSTQKRYRGVQHDRDW